MLTAEVASALPPDPDAPERYRGRGLAWDREIERSSARSTSEGDRARTLTAGADVPARIYQTLPSVEGLGDLDSWSLDRRLRECLCREQRLDSRVGALVSIVSKKGIHRAYGFASASRYADELLGLSGRQAQRLLRIERAVQECAPLARAYRSAAVSWAQADLLVPLVFADTLGRWWESWV